MANDPSYLPYSPQTTNAQTITPALLPANNVHTVRITWVDLINNIRFRAVPLSLFQRLLASSRPGVMIAQGAFGIAGITLAPGFGPVGEYSYVLDLTTIRLCSYAPGHASIVGWFQDMTPAPGRVLGTGVPMCPRSVLKRVIEYELSSLFESFLVGVESEFILLKNTNPVEPVNVHGYSNSQALASGTKETEIMEDIAQGLVKSGIELMMYHSEAAPGQYEVVTGPLPPLEAADALVHTRETIFNMASKHGFRATFAPRLYLDNCGSAAHAHISVHPIDPEQPFGLQPSATEDPEDLSATSENVLTPLERAFLAGLLDYLPAACAFTLPICASYARMVDGIWSGGTWIAWGTPNRETPVRLCSAILTANPPSGDHFEVKYVDGTSSPYLTFSGLLGAGLLGIQSRSPLIEKDCMATAATMTEAEREAVGVKRRLPRTWEEAGDALEGDVAMRDLLG
ncbi:glutamine synthetase/guanido kinase, partial [Rhizopogon salebrosus TDB-379]